MQVQRVLRMPVYAPMGVTAKLPEPSGEQGRYKSFGMLQEPEGRIFYECSDCGRCGCPSFDYYPGPIPQEIVDHLMWHAQLCGE